MANGFAVAVVAATLIAAVPSQAAAQETTSPPECREMAQDFLRELIEIDTNVDDGDITAAAEAIWKRAHGWKDWGSTMGPETAEIWGSWGRLSKAAFAAAARSDFEEMERIREILDRARTELEAL